MKYEKNAIRPLSFSIYPHSFHPSKHIYQLSYFKCLHTHKCHLSFVCCCCFRKKIILFLVSHYSASCRYEKSQWSECNPESNIKTRTLSLKKGDEGCIQTRTIQKKCKKGIFSCLLCVLKKKKNLCRFFIIFVVMTSRSFFLAQ